MNKNESGVELIAEERPERLSLAERRDMEFEKFRRNLRILRAGINISAVQLSQEIGFKIGGGKRIIDLEYGRGNPKLDELLAIAKYFNVTLDELLYKTAKINFE